ncbi:MAG: ABC transporter substrate-binding protein [Acidimicrobiales bacterium]
MNQRTTTEFGIRPLTRRQFLTAAGGGSLALVLAGCGSAVRGSSTAGTAVSGGKPKRGGVAAVAQSNDISPPLLYSVNGANLGFSRLVYNTLTELDHKTLVPKPSLATSWTVSADRRTYTFQLRPGVKFHSGRPFGPQDVIANVRILQDPAHSSQLRQTAMVVSDMTASGANEVTLQLAHPINNLFDVLEVMFITDSETVPEALAGKAFNGTGPFVFKSFTPEVSTDLQRNPSYWKAGLPYLDGVTLPTIANADALVSSLKTKRTDISIAVQVQALPEFQHTPGYAVIQVDTNADSSYIGINTAVPPFDKKEVRQAIAYAIDRNRLFKQAFLDTGQMTDIPWPRNSPAYEAALVNHYEYNLKMAKSLLQQAGVGGFTTEIAVTYATDPDALTAQYNLQQIGIDAKIKTYLGGGAFFQHLAKGTFAGMWSSGHLFGNLHPATLVTAALPYNPLHNSSNYKDPTYAALAQQIWTLPPGTQLDAAYHSITQILLDEAFVLELNTGGDIYVTSSSFRNWGVNMFDYFDFDDAYLA